VAEEKQGNGQHKRPKWSWYQIALGSFYSLAAIAMYVVQGIDQLMWGTDLDFSMLPHILLAIGTYVIFGPVVSDIVTSMVGTKEK
jgi:branched-subunit amino acid ABC-type transport system permease component